VDRCIVEQTAGTLTPAEAAGVKAWTTEQQFQVLDRCLQLHGGYGYMTEYAIGRMYADARVSRIYGGANEIMKEIISKGMGVG
jgi:alkylation response protein AidB-like acyl-CoA dehydrogenase